MKKGYAIMMDSIMALVAVMLIFLTITGLTYTRGEATSMSFQRLHYTSEDVMDSLNKVGALDRVGEDWAAANGNVSDPHWINATALAAAYLDELIPENMGYMFTIDDDLIANNSRGIDTSTAPSKTHAIRLLVGYGRGLPTRGNVARALLSNIKNKETSAYAYFGGYVGQGNLTVYINDLPLDANIIQACLEMNAGDNFTLYVNDNQVPNIGTIESGGGNMSANIKCESCAPGAGCGIIEQAYLTYFQGGDNKIELKFTSPNISNRYVGGGFVRLKYNTSEMDTDQISSVDYHPLPGINGVINLYDAFYLPPNMASINMTLHFKSNYSTYFIIGDKTVYSANRSESNRTVVLNDTYLKSFGCPICNNVEGETIPIRMGTGNMSYTIESGNADVILITDLSGSMDYCINNNSDCTGSPKQRLTLARQMDRTFINLVLNSSGNRIGLVTYNQHGYNNHNLSSSNNSLINTVNSFTSPDGSTCICCAIRMAKMMLQNQSSPGRGKYILVMTDGIANRRCSPTTENRTTCCTQDASNCVNPRCGDGRYDSVPCGDVVDDIAIQNAINDSEKAHKAINVTVNSIGFGAGAIGCTPALNALINISKYGNGTYCASDNATQLENCYVGFADQIVTESKKSQTIVFGGLLQGSVLYPDSHIMFEYSPANTTAYGEISLTTQTGRFNDPLNCSGELQIPPGVIVSDVKATSYSAEHWTDYLQIDNSGHSSEAKYRLWAYGVNYTALGDPYIISIPASDVPAGENTTVTVCTGDEGESRTGCIGGTGCSRDNRAIYTIRLKSLVSYGNVFPESEGCNWVVEFEDGSTYNSKIPLAYNGTFECNYTHSSRGYNQRDAMADAVNRLLTYLDLDKDGRVDVLFNPNMIIFEVGRAGGVQSLWGPAEFKLILWM